jgi:hypothetical protein
MKYAALKVVVSLLALAGVSACTTVRVGYEPASTLSTDPIATASENAYLFRIPRSQISLKFTGTGFNPVVLDAQAAGSPDRPEDLPQNAGYGYQVSIVDMGAQALTKAEFFSAVAGKEVHVFPVPSCAMAKITLYQFGASNTVAFSATAVPTELALPATNDAMPAASPLYLLKPKSDFVSTTNLSVTYLDNSKIVSKVGASVTDNISTTLKDVTAIAVAAASVAAPPAPPPAGADNKWHKVGTAVVTIASNDNVDVIPIPKAGTVVMNSTCGASTTSTGSTSNADQAAQDLVAAMTDAKQIYTAWKSK